MTLRTVFANLPAGGQPAALFDAVFNDIEANAVVQCTATGATTIALTPTANQINITSYVGLQLFGFIAVGNCGANATINVSGVGAKTVFVDAYGGAFPTIGGEMRLGNYYIVAFDPALASGAGGFHLLNPTLALFLRSYIAGLILSMVGGSATFNVAAGQATSDDQTTTMELTAAFSKTTAAWAAGSGNGGLDTGAIAASTWYYPFLIANPVAGTVDVVFSLSSFAPTLPTGYTKQRRIGALRTDGSSNWLQFIQKDDDFIWVNPVNDINATTVATTAILATLTVPQAFKVTAMLRGSVVNAAVSTLVLFSSLDETDNAPNTPVGNITAESIVANVADNWGLLLIRTNASGQIRYRTSATSTVVQVTTVGWIDTRGRNL